MDFITDTMLAEIEHGLNKALRPECSRFVYEVITGDSILFQFLLDDYPDDKQLQQLATKAMTCIDAVIPLGESIPRWDAAVIVGAKSVINLALDGDRIATFEGNTVAYPRTIEARLNRL